MLLYVKPTDDVPEYNLTQKRGGTQPASGSDPSQCYSSANWSGCFDKGKICYMFRFWEVTMLLGIAMEERQPLQTSAQTHRILLPSTEAMSIQTLTYTITLVTRPWMPSVNHRLSTQNG